MARRRPLAVVATGSDPSRRPAAAVRLRTWARARPMERARRESVVAADGDSTEEEAVAALLVHAQARLRALGLVQEFLPDADSTAKCAIFVSEGWESEDKLLLILQNAVGARPGLWSRSLCLSHGLTKGSMLPCVERARAEGMGVVILVSSARRFCAARA